MEPHGVRGFFAGLGPAGALLAVLPFASLLGCLAVLPPAAPRFWERNRNKGLVALALSAPVAVFLLIEDPALLAATALDYAAFMGLLGALFTISGGIYVKGALAGRPLVNAAFLAAGALLANLVGTTGASMLLIRPLLRANRRRRRKTHVVVFFIFIVANCAGLLTPLGDPPLFLGFLRGVDFAWTLRLWPQWLAVVVALLLASFLVDQYQFDKEDIETKGSLVEDVSRHERLGLEGGLNLAWLAVVLGLVLASAWLPHSASKVVQIAGFALAAAASFWLTPRAIHERNEFAFGPIVEVAVLFAGIFVTMTPALLILETQGGRLGVEEPWRFFWMTGLLSSFLDNAPTYLAFTSLAKGVLGLGGEGLSELAAHPAGASYLAAVSCGAVFMGANTYIGNGPNFMVKSIAERGKVRMPGFFGYMAWSGAVLLPLFVITTLLFFG